MKISISKAIQAFVGLACICLYLYTERIALHSVYMRYFYLITAVIMIAGTILLSWLKLRDLRELNGDALKREVRKEKLVAELCAAVAVIAFTGVFFREGYEFDKSNWQARFNEISIASSTLQASLPQSFCVSKPNPSFSCADVVKQLNASVQAIPPDGSEKDFREKLDRVKSMVSALAASSTGKQRVALLSVQDDIEAVKMNSDVLDFMLRTLPLLLFLGAISAVSRKVAIAWRENDENRKGGTSPQQAGQQPEQSLGSAELAALIPSQSILPERAREPIRDQTERGNMGFEARGQLLRAVSFLLFVGAVSTVARRVVFAWHKQDETSE